MDGCRTRRPGLVGIASATAVGASGRWRAVSSHGFSMKRSSPALVLAGIGRRHAYLCIRMAPDSDFVNAPIRDFGRLLPELLTRMEDKKFEEIWKMRSSCAYHCAIEPGEFGVKPSGSVSRTGGTYGPAPSPERAPCPTDPALISDRQAGARSSGLGAYQGVSCDSACHVKKAGKTGQES